MAFSRLADSTRRDMRGRLDWIRVAIGEAKYVKIEPHHVAALMEKKGGPAAANRLRKDLGQLYRFAGKRLGYRGPNPAALADVHRTKKGGYHTWTDERSRPTGPRTRPAPRRGWHSKSLLNTARHAWTRSTSRARTSLALGSATADSQDGQEVDLPILPELGRELSYLPPTQMVLLSREDGSKGYANESFGNLFRRWCAEAGLPHCAAHGLRKAGARRLAEAQRDRI